MSQLRVEKLTMPAANLGRENPLPMLAPRLSATAGSEFDASVPMEDRKHFGYGLDAGWLPHRGQDDYDRNRKNRDFLALVLENEILRATILPEVGGRLWSLFHKPSGRDLLFVNPVFQPANLAVRGAWVTGGVEWNACVYGHSPYTCSPVFAAVVETGQGGEILRIYEWDRTRGIPYQLDFSLPDNSPFLFVRVRLANPHAQTVPMYWWSNITIAESPDVRVLTPATSAYTYDYWGPVHAVSVPRHQEFDLTNPTNIRTSADYFFRIPDGTRPWIAALDSQGCGLIHTSTSRLRGRKLFAWGSNPGGRRWQEFLSTAGHSYFEIQAGLARTQMECLPMPGGAQWDWMEAYGLMDCDAELVHGRDWVAAVSEVAGRLQQQLPAESLEAQLQQSAAVADYPPKDILHRGSGWGALERQRRSHRGESPFCSSRLVFDDDSLGDNEAPWLSLLHNGMLPDCDPKCEPGAWMIQTQWRELLEASLQRRGGDHWLAQLHLGLMHFADGNLADAESAWRESLQRSPSGWAYRNLAVLCQLEGDTAKALSYFRLAYQCLPTLRPLLIEYCEALLTADRAADALALIDAAPEAVRCHSRLRLLEARAGLALDVPERLQAILRHDYELVDIREGESSLTDLWIALRSTKRAGKYAQLWQNNGKQNGEPHFAIPGRLDFQVVPDPHFKPVAHQPGKRESKSPRFFVERGTRASDHSDG